MNLALFQMALVLPKYAHYWIDLREVILIDIVPTATTRVRSAFLLICARNQSELFTLNRVATSAITIPTLTERFKERP